MNKQIEKQLKSERRHKRLRAKVRGTEERPRLSVFRSNRGVYLQLINDLTGRTLVSICSRELKVSKQTKVEAANELGKALAAKALERNIRQAVFDRGGFKYHGRIKAVADGAREGGLQF